VTPSFPNRIQGMVLRDSSPSPSGLRLVGFHHLWQAISGHFGFAGEKAAGPATLHPPQVSLWGLVWTFPLSLTLLRESRLVSFPSLTKIFPFREFPFLTEGNGVPWESVARSLIQASPDLSLHAAPRGISLLAAPFFSAQAWSSARRRNMSGLLGSLRCLSSVGTHIWPVFGFHCEQIKAHSTLCP
jgi:hypothetical protein